MAEIRVPVEKELHRQTRLYALNHDKTMADVVRIALQKLVYATEGSK